MSAIDFKMELAREPDPKGDRVKIVMSGKYLQYKTCWNGRQKAPFQLRALERTARPRFNAPSLLRYRSRCTGSCAGSLRSTAIRE